MKPIDVDEIIKRKSFINKLHSTLNTNDKTEEPVFAENEPEEASENPEIIDK